jgi:hypothetical protein
LIAQRLAGSIFPDEHSPAIGLVLDQVPIAEKIEHLRIAVIAAVAGWLRVKADARDWMSLLVNRVKLDAFSFLHDDLQGLLQRNGELD